MMDDTFKPAVHNPPHLFRSGAIYMLTASTYQREPLIYEARRKADWRDAFLRSAGLYQWEVIAWVVLDNHYHAIVRSPEDAGSLSRFIASYHKFTARHWNEEDGLPGRQVWWNYWDTCIHAERDYRTRLRYVFWNPAKHGLVERPEDYPFSSYRDFLSGEEGFQVAGTDEVIDVPEF
jgi:putative transposase